MGPPWFDRYTVPLALVLVLLSGIGPVIAWRRATLANARRNFLVPCAAALGTLLVLLATGVEGKPLRDRDVLLRGVRVRQRRAGVLPRHARAARDGGGGGADRARRARAAQPPALRRLRRAPRDRRAVHRRRRVLVLPARLRAGAVARPVDARRRLHGALRAPDGHDHARATTPPTPARRSASGAVLDVSKSGRHVATLKPSEGFYASNEPTQGSVGSLIGGQPVSHVSMDAGVTRDVWSAIAPNIEAPPLKRIVEPRQRDAVARRGARRDRAPGARLPEGAAAGPVPLHRLAAGDVDLDRRADRLRGRADRDLARAEHRAPRGRRALAARARCAGSPAREPRERGRRRPRG